MNQPTSSSSSPTTPATSGHDGGHCGRHGHHHRRGGFFRGLLAGALLFGVIAGAAYVGSSQAHPGMRGGHGMLHGSFDPESAAKRIDAMVSFVLADVDASGLLEPSHPALVSVQGSLWASWRTAATPGQVLAEELWLQPLAWSAMTGLDLSAPVVPLPRQTGHQPGDQRRPALAAVGSSLAVAWEDLGRTFAPLGANRAVVVELAPLPLLRLEEVTP